MKLDDGFTCNHVISAIHYDASIKDPDSYVKFYPSLSDESVFVHTTPYIASFLVSEWDAIVLETNGKLETVYQYMTPRNKGGEFKTSQKGVTPQYIFKTAEKQNAVFQKALKSKTPNLVDNSDWQIMEQLIDFDLEDTSKLVWTRNDTDRGVEYILQFRTSYLSVLVKVASNNFVSFFVKCIFPPTGDEALKKFKSKCNELKFKVIGSLIRSQDNGLFHFYEQVHNCDEWYL